MTDSTDNALKPCPFCGGEPHYSRKGLDERFAYADMHTIKCAGCGVERSVMDDQNPKGGYALNGTGKPKVIAAWNTRAERAEAALATARRDALEEAATVTVAIEGIGHCQMPVRWREAIRALDKDATP